jgi:hypothetical protein
MEKGQGNWKGGKKMGDPQRMEISKRNEAG